MKVVRSHAEKLITRAKKNLVTDLKPEVQLHNKREVMKRIKDREVVVKLFEDIAKRFETKNGGYTRVLKLVNRISDNSEVGILELTSRKERSTLLKERIEKREIQTKAREEKRATRKSNSAPVSKETTSKKK
ncbi:ribosomal protein L17 [Leptospira interrogans serovar Icterohaemorrhagiae str. Verdun HP]|uniref:50S ribosomal protein L17 n=1 Tax=Leptospira interrogans serovar Icterohaemorrhagiae str. Verdun HP TaxID=1049910 RepID=M6RMP9_LEPIR|nr:ribosomal protein L17 [Leptospira interrogans serovar Icterohaemorrhagiae str. Verdun HP]